MARARNDNLDYTGPVRRILIGLLLVLLFGLTLFWRIDSPRVERMRAAVVDRVVPSFEWALAPVRRLTDMVENFESYAKIYEQNKELRRELRQMKAWKEAALQLDQENAKLLELNKVRLDPQLTFVTGVVLTDSGSPFRQSVLLNVGQEDGIMNGWATTDGLGLVGRISGVGQRTARVILLNDSSSRVPVLLQASGQHALLTGDNAPQPVLEFIENQDLVKAGDRVVSSGDGKLFPAGLLVGYVTRDGNGRFRVRLAADYQRLEFLRVLRARATYAPADPGALVVPAPDHPLGDLSAAPAPEAGQ